MKLVYLWPICCVIVWLALIALVQVFLRLSGAWVIPAVIIAIPFGVLIGAGIAGVMSHVIQRWIKQERR
jgi:hypothetical protein